MAVNYTEEQLNNVDKSFLIQLLLQQQEQLNALTKELHASNEKMQLLMEQVILGKQNRFGRSSEKMEDDCYFHAYKCYQYGNHIPTVFLI